MTQLTKLYKAMILITLIFIVIILNSQYPFSISNKTNDIDYNLINATNSVLGTNKFITTFSTVGVQKILEKRENKYSPNNHYMINNNLAQYSSYLIVDEKNITIEAFVHFNRKQSRYEKFDGKENFSCLLKLLPYGDRQDEEDVELEVFEFPKFYWNHYNRKLIFKLELMKLKKDYDEKRDRDLILKHLVVAVIWNHDFNKSIDMENIKILDNSSIILPFNLIKYQIPSIIYSKIPRLESIAFCVHFVYSLDALRTQRFIDLHLSFGVREIRIYDAVENRSLTKYLKNIYGDDDRITVMPVDISFQDLCNDSILLKQFNNISSRLKDYMKKSCKIFYEAEFHEKYPKREGHEQLTANDCFTVLKQKYQFIGYLDLDEILLPRTLENIKDFNSPLIPHYSCKTFSLICSLKPFQFNSNKNEVSNKNYLYNYLMSLVEKNKNGRDMKQLGSIGFAHGLYMIPDYIEKQLIYDIGEKIEMIEKNSSIKFPLRIPLSLPSSKVSHTFVIEKNDVDYVKYFYESYQNLIPCIYKAYLQNIPGVDKNAIRYLSFLDDEGYVSFRKGFHYYKNVNTIWLHYAIDVEENTWGFGASIYDHYFSHFRSSVTYLLNRNVFGSIRKLNIDYEYVSFLLQNYTSFCQI